MNDYYQNNYLVKVIFMLLDLCAFVLSVSGNSMVIYVMSRERKLRKKSNYYIISVAMADLLIGVIGIPAILYTFVTGEPRDKDFCLILFSFALAMYTVSVYTLVAVSLDRYVAICHPLYYETSVGTRETRRTVAICWCMGAIGLLPVFGWKDDHLSKEDEKCHPKDVLDFNFIIFMCVIVCFVPTIIITCTYLSMYKEIIIQSRIRSTMVYQDPSKRETTPSRELKAAKTFSMIVGSFVVCWMPQTITYFIFAIRKQRDFNENILDIFTILSHFNSAIDPVIYAFRIRSIRRAIKSVFKCDQQTGLCD